MTVRRSSFLRPARRALLKAGAGAAIAAGLHAATGRPAFAKALPDVADVLDEISVGNMVKPIYRKLYRLGADDELWDPGKDWIRTADWEAVRKAHAGKILRMAIGAADYRSALAQAPVFARLSGIVLELVAIPDEQMYDRLVANFRGDRPGFDAVQFFSPWMGDFASQGLLHPLDDFAEKWKLPFDDFYETYRLNYGRWADKGILGIPYDCDLQMFHIRPSMFAKIGITADRINAVASYDDLLRIAPELAKAEPGAAAMGMMLKRGFWATYTWQHVAAQHGLEMFDANWHPVFNGEAGIKGLETVVALSRHAGGDAATSGWAENRAAWLGGRIACSMSWQDLGTQATRPDLSKIGDDVLTIFEPRVAGGRFAPPNVAGSTACVPARAPEPEAAFLAIAYLTSASVMAINEANATGVSPGAKSVLANPKLQAVSEPAAVWAEELDFAWCAPRLPGSFEIEQEIGLRVNAAVTGRMAPRAALDEAAAKVREIMTRNGFYQGKDPMNANFAAAGQWIGRGKPLPF